jgi:hypothetical protein
MRDLNGIACGMPGPGVTARHIAGVRRLASRVGFPIVIFGSRQSGFSCHTGLPFREDSDIDLGVVGGPAELLRLVDYLTSVGNKMPPGVEHSPMWIYTSVEEAVGRGHLVVLPR